ncbi:MAG: tRNA1(Val) (adenine(37)-N6)-methyltransferase [Ruminococcaceae bacterium]|nr:tRNA1(Val) (adenine(37)-N6)-methyltransferase [Oscillospiraceae bacterium]
MDTGVNIKKEPLGNGFFAYVSKSHTFGTDAVLLADFAKTKKVKTHCDLGTGCGIIPLLLLRDSVTEQSVGVEISDEAVSLAEKSANDKFAVLHSDLKDLKGKLPFGTFDLVTCNPPYKADGAGIKSRSQRDIVARHETMCTLEDVIETSSKLLKSSGNLCLCQRPERLGDIICLMRKYKVEPKRIRIVCKKTGEEPWLVLVEGKRDAKSGVRILPPLFVYDEKGNLSSEMLEIYGPYKEGHI